MESGTVYLIHLDSPLGKPLSDAERAERGRPPRTPGWRFAAQHYIGFTTNLEERLQHHRSGNGSSFMAAATFNMINWHVARTWEGDRSLERRLKNLKDSDHLCPICNPDSWQRNGIFKKRSKT